MGNAQIFKVLTVNEEFFKNSWSYVACTSGSPSDRRLLSLV